jgi:hypothetical protein
MWWSVLVDGWLWSVFIIVLFAVRIAVWLSLRQHAVWMRIGSEQHTCLLTYVAMCQVIHTALFVCKTVISLLRLITLVVVVVVVLLLLTLLFILRGTDGEGDTRVRGTELKSPRSSRQAGGRPEVSCLSPAVAHLFCMACLFLRHVAL